MKNDLLASSFLTDLDTPDFSDTPDVPFELNPVMQLPENVLHLYYQCPREGCMNWFTARKGVCHLGVFHCFENDFAGRALFCSLECTLASVYSQGSDGHKREFRDESKTLH